MPAETLGSRKAPKAGLEGSSGGSGVVPRALLVAGGVSQDGFGGSQRVALRIVRTADHGFVIWGPTDGLDAGVRQGLMV